MNCQSLRDMVSELARNGSRDAIDPALRERTLVHLDECAECFQRFQDERALTSRLQEMAQQMKSLTAPEHVEAQLRKTFQETVAASRAPARRQVIEVNQWRRLALAAAVVLIVAIVGLGWYLTRTAQPRNDRSNVAKTKPEEPKEISTVNPPAESKETPEGPANRSNTPRRLHSTRNAKRNVLPSPNANEVGHEVATQFMPIGFAGPINPQDGGELVRVELSRSAMLSLGLPVNMDRFGQSVKADVLLGPDGFARAIRFVQ